MAGDAPIIELLFHHAELLKSGAAKEGEVVGPNIEALPRTSGAFDFCEGSSCIGTDSGDDWEGALGGMLAQINFMKNLCSCCSSRNQRLASTNHFLQRRTGTA